MGKKGGGGETSQTTVQKADPWAGVQPNLLDLYGSAGGWFHNNAPMTAGSNYSLNHSIDLTRAAADRSQSGLDTAEGALKWLSLGNDMDTNPYANGQALRDDPTANGAYLGKQNPFLRQMVDAASQPIVQNFQQAVAPSLASQFSMAGRMGSGAHIQAAQNAENTLGQQLGNVSANLYGNDYEAERGRMAQARLGLQGMQAQGIQEIRNRSVQAAGMMPGLAQARYLGGQALQQSGMMERQIQQEQMQEPFQRLSAYSGLLSGAAPYASTTGSQNSSAQQPYNRLTGTIGGGLGGYALGSMMGFGPMGALVGGLGGLFG